jgi:integrase
MEISLIRFRQLFDCAIVAESHPGPNPVDRAWLRVKAGKAPLNKKPHPSIPWRDVPEYFASLQALPLVESLGLQFQILTAVRPSESREASWIEIDRQNGIWAIPASRMKGKNLHRVPLSRQALDILSQLKTESPFLFPNKRRFGAMNSNAFRKLLPEGVSLHGFRSSFRSWIADDPLERFSPDVAEMALAHVVGGDVERVYRQGDQLNKRRPLMQAWADFLEGAAP